MKYLHENSPFLKIAYITINNNSSKQFLDYNFFLVLDGSIRILKDKETIFMGKNDIFLFEPGNTYQVSSAGNNIILSVILDSRFFQNGRSLHSGHFICNSALDSSRDYRPLQQLLTQIAATYFGNTDILHLQLIALSYSLLYYLNAYHYETSSVFSIPVPNEKNNGRIIQILDFIHQNYASPITLQEAAEKFHLSPPYLSTFFKQNMQKNFSSYVNHIRLAHAVEELIYTDKSITSITFDNGFASINTFHKIFREEYQTTPNHYRKEKEKERSLQTDSIGNAMEELPVSQHAGLLQEYGVPSIEFFHNIQFPAQETIVVEDMRHGDTVTPIWKKLLNVGPLAQLSKRDIEKQLHQIQEGVGFIYARIEEVADYGLLSVDTHTDKLLFTAFDRAIDILRMHQLIPYLDLSIPQETVLLGKVPEDKHNNIVVDIDKYMSFLKQLIRHNANMYGFDYMESWYFEINHYEIAMESRYEGIDCFIDRFTRSYCFIKELLPKANVGGICHDVLSDYNRFHDILKRLRQKNIQPDFLCLGVFPYEFIPKGTEKEPSVGIYYTRDVSFAKNKLVEFKKMIAEHMKILPEIHISYLAPDLFTGHYLNDTCFQSSFFFHNTVDLIGEVDMLGYYQMSDIGSRPEESNDFLEGRNGLFNKYGIKKPGCHLLEIFSKCHNQLVTKDSDFVVLKGTRERYMIGMCNYTYVSDSNCFSIHEKIPIADAYKIYESPKTKNIDLKLKNLAAGDYDVVIYQINKSHGSALDEWARNGYWNRFSRNELEYTRKILQPLRTHHVKSSSDGNMEFHMQLAPHEVIFIFLLLRW